ncbi:hypothetical protein ACWGQ4_32585 [Streptomyces sp. NPDC055721]
MAELAGYARFRDAMERSHITTDGSVVQEREPATTATPVSTSPSG